MEFEKRKAAALAAMSAPESDKSPKGTLDAPIVPLLDALNRRPSYFTTSSCSGRISILSHSPTPAAAATSGDNGESSNASEETNKNNKKKKAGGGSWLLVTHGPAEPESVVDLLFGNRTPPDGGSAGGGALVFRFEPLIIAVECRDAESAQSLVSTAISCGFRESGITSLRKRIMVAIRCSIRLEVPLGEVGRIMVSPEYVQYLVGIANEKMEANRRRTDGFFQVLQCECPPRSARVMPKKHQRQWGEKADQGSLLGGNEVDQGSSSGLASKQQDVKIPLLEIDSATCIGLHEPALCIFQDMEMDTFSKSSTKKSNNCCEMKVADHNEEEADKDLDFHSWSPRAPECVLSVVRMMIVGEPVEKLFLWGQSACTLNKNHQNQIFIFGGFGGLGRHSRRNDSLTLDPQSGLLKGINAEGPPSPRLGHTSSVVEKHIFVIGGRGDPMQIFNDVWVLDTIENRWRLLECSGDAFQPRHRHAAAVVGSNIYVYGGLNNEVIYSCMHVLNSETLQWSEINIQGEWPCARHSHSLVADGNQLFMFGGYDGEKALSDLYKFDVQKSLWKMVRTTGTAPFPRFSHSTFVYKSFLGIVGGCPVRQQYQEVTLLDLRHLVWRCVVVDSVDRELWVRSSINVVDDELVIVGGGASCYAFGTKFSQPMKVSLGPLVSADSILSEEDVSVTKGEKSLYGNEMQTTSCTYKLNLVISKLAPQDVHLVDSKYLVLQLERKYGKLAKDILKWFRWLDLERKVGSSQDGHHILLPVSSAFFEEVLNFAEEIDSADGHHLLLSFKGKGLPMNEISVPKALNVLLACDPFILEDEKACSRKVHKNLQMIMQDAICSLIQQKGILPHLLEQVPTRWEHIGDILVLPVTSFKDPIWDSIGEELWPIVAKSLGACRLARQGRVLPTGTRDSTLEILVGDNGWVTHHENGISYSFDATKCMFSSGNLSEKLRMGLLDCKDEVIVDLFAGIGYFVLPFLAKAKAKFVYACEWNPHALYALQHNLQANLVEGRCVILEGDNQITTPRGVADRVCLGLLPSSESSWLTAVRALKPEGGILHVHGNVNDLEEELWSEYVAQSIGNIAKSEGYSWDVSVQHLERVKWYGPHIRHLVADIRCKGFVSATNCTSTCYASQ